MQKQAKPPTKKNSTSTKLSTRGLDHLDVYLNDKKIGIIEKTSTGKQRFVYSDEWINGKKSIPISLALPLTKKSHDTTTTANFMWGLLPDNSSVLQQWSIRYGVSPNNPFGLLASVGEDCPGAVQLIIPDSDVAGREGIAWITDDEFKQRIKELKSDPGAARKPDDNGRISLPGAQIKTALYRLNNRWGIPRGRTPTTHILKPEPMPGLATKEHFTLLLMREVRLPTAESEVVDVDDIPVFVTRRYDRFFPKQGPVRRIHQEDMCQALGIPPAKKYQQDGGPGITEIMNILRHSESPETDRDRFMRSQVFNFLVGNGDAHAKNYSILYGSGGAYRLAPFYDVIFLDSKQLAMTIGGERKVEDIRPKNWERAAKLASYDKDRAVTLVRDMIARISGAALNVRHSINLSTSHMRTVDDIVDKLWLRLRRVAHFYGAELLNEYD